MVLDRPEIPLHTNGSENDVRCQVTRRKVSGGTRSDTGRDCRHSFLALAKPASNWAFRSGTISVPGWRSQAVKPSHLSPA
jgi:hypothetical protein